MTEILTEAEIQVMADSEWGTCVATKKFLTVIASHKALQYQVSILLLEIENLRDEKPE